MISNPLGDWPEDFDHEDGRYLCKCIECGDLFTGHKRRHLCKACETALKAEWDALTPEQQHQRREEALAQLRTSKTINE